MIAFVRGQVAAVGLTSAVVEVGGIGLEVLCTPGTLATLRPGQSARQALRIAREERLMIVIGPRKEGTLTLDIGTGGFAAVVGPLAARIVCEFELHIPGEAVTGRARVVSSAKGDDGSPRTSSRGSAM